MDRKLIVAEAQKTPESEREPFGYAEAHEAAQFIKGQIEKSGLALPTISLTLGSGLKSFAERFTDKETRLVIPTKDIPYFPQPKRAAAGHDGTLIIAPIDDNPQETMAIWSGRVHYYQILLRKCAQMFASPITDPEVWKAAVVFYIAINRALGIQDILTSNAVGSVRPELHKKGDIVRVSDHILDPDEDFGVPEDERWFQDKKGKDYDYAAQSYFYSQGNLYSAEIFALAQEVAAEMGMDLKEGILHWRKGRGYESPAMTEAIRRKGADLAGMSTAPEAQKARTIGYSNVPGEKSFTAFSMVTNVAQITHEQVLQHSEVVEAGKGGEGLFNPFMKKLITRIRAKRLSQNK
jgi:purine-nucleoside phosphorylase